MNSTAHDFLSQNRNSCLLVRRVDQHNQACGKPILQLSMKAIQFPRRNITSQQYLPPLLSDRIHRFQQLLLTTRLAREGLDVIDGEDPQFSKTLPELMESFLPQSSNELMYEMFGRKISHPSFPLDEELPGDRLQKVGLSQPTSAMEEQWIEGDPWSP
jgi:hypothetical protein